MNFITLRDCLKTAAGSDLGFYSNELGQTIPAIWVIPPQIPDGFRMQHGSGIEIVINASPEMKTEGMMFYAVSLVKTYEILIRQYNPGSPLEPVLIRILSVLGSVTYCQVSSQTQTAIGLSYEQARIGLRESTYIKSTL